MSDRNRNRSHLPTEKDFSGGAIQKHVLKETIQHPATIIPLGVAGGFTGLMVLGFMVINPVTLVIPVAVGLAGGGFWVYNYAIRGKDIASRYIQDLRSQIELVRQNEILGLKDECDYAGFEEGSKEADELEAAYIKIKSFLEKKIQAGQELDAARYQSLAKDIYKEGLRLLRSALEGYKALQAVDIKALKRDRESYQRQLGKAKDGSVEAKSLAAKVKNHDDRIRSYERHNDAIHQRMAQLEDLEGALENSYLELVDLAQGRGFTTPTESVSRLEQAVQAARKVEDMLRGEDTSKENQMYFEAGKDSQLRQ